MATFKLPTSLTQANYEFEVDLDTQPFRLRLKFNSRDEAWYMSLFDAVGVEIRSGIKVVSDWSLLRMFRDTNIRPVGGIFTINLGPDVAKPAIDQLGGDTLLVYDGDS